MRTLVEPVIGASTRENLSAGAVFRWVAEIDMSTWGTCSTASPTHAARHDQIHFSAFYALSVNAL